MQDISEKVSYLQDAVNIERQGKPECSEIAFLVMQDLYELQNM